MAAGSLLPPLSAMQSKRCVKRSMYYHSRSHAGHVENFGVSSGFFSPTGALIAPSTAITFDEIWPIVQREVVDRRPDTVAPWRGVIVDCRDSITARRDAVAAASITANAQAGALFARSATTNDETPAVNARRLSMCDATTPIHARCASVTVASSTIIGRRVAVRIMSRTVTSQRDALDAAKRTINVPRITVTNGDVTSDIGLDAVAPATTQDNPHRCGKQLQYGGRRCAKTPLVRSARRSRSEQRR